MDKNGKYFRQTAECFLASPGRASDDGRDRSILTKGRIRVDGQASDEDFDPLEDIDQAIA